VRNIITDRDREVFRRDHKLLHDLKGRRNFHRRRQPLDPPDAGIPFRNETSETIPAYGLIVIATSFARGWSITVGGKPGLSTEVTYAANGPMPVLAGEWGRCYCSGIVPLLHDGAAALSRGDTLGAKPGQWSAAKGYPAIATVTGDAGESPFGGDLVKVQWGTVNRLLVKLRATSTKNSATPVTCDILWSSTPGSGETAISEALVTISAFNKFGSLPVNTVAWAESNNGYWYIVSPVAGTGGLIRFELRSALAPGSSATAAVLTWDTGSSSYIPLLDDEEDEILINVADFTSPGTWRGHAPVVGGPNGCEGWCVPVSDRTFTPTESVPDTTCYEIVWMEMKARHIHFKLHEAIDTQDASALAYVVRWGDGINPTDDALEDTITVFNQVDDSPFMPDNSYRYHSLTGYVGEAVYDPETDKYWITSLKTPAPFIFGHLNAACNPGASVMMSRWEHDDTDGSIYDTGEDIEIWETNLNDGETAIAQYTRVQAHLNERGRYIMGVVNCRPELLANLPAVPE